MKIPGDRFNSLKERERQCLRLFYARYEVKEIARRLALTPNTVNEHLRTARKILGVARSVQAARLLAEHEGYDRLVSKPIGIEADAVVEEERSATLGERSGVAVERYRSFSSPLVRTALIVLIAWVLVALGGSLLMGTNALTHVFEDRGIDISDAPYRN